MQPFSIFIRLLILFVFSQTVLTAQTKMPSVLDLMNLEIPSVAAVSADGAWASFVIRKPSNDFKKWESVVYLININTGTQLKVTHEADISSTPLFTSDGGYLTYISNKNYKDPLTDDTVKGKNQIWRVSVNGTQQELVSSLSNGIEEYTLSRNGKLLAVLTTAEDPELFFNIDGKKLIADENIFPHKNPVKILVVYSLDTRREEYRYTLDAGAQDISFSPSGEMVIYQSNQTGDYNDEQKFDLFSIDKKGKINQVTKFAGPETSALFSPDGKKLGFITQTVPDIEFAESDIQIMNPDGNGLKNLTADFNYAVQSFIWKNNSSILFIAAEKYTSSLYELDINSGRMNKISPEDKSISNIAVTSDGSMLWREESSSTISELVFNGKMLTTYSNQLNNFSSGSQEVVIYPAKDKKFELNGILFKPDNYEAGKKYPLIVTIHGGPYGYFRNTFQQTYPTKVLTSMGYMVFAPNPRGSLGGSDDFGQANRYDLGGGDYEDIMTGVDYLIAQGLVDENKMGVMGGSYGGYLTNWVISQTTRFKAAVSLYGIFSFFTDWSNSWQPIFEKMYFGHYYWEKPIDMKNLYVNRSPAFYADKIKTPTLILQGEKDLYTDVANSREMFQALNTLGVPVTFIIYPGEGHGIRNKPYHYANVMQRTIDWFEKYLK